MSITELLEKGTIWLGWSALGLFAITVICFLFGWGLKFRLVGATIFTFLLSGSCWAFAKSYTPPFVVENALYAPVVYDNGYDLVVAQASDDFPGESIQPTLEQIAGNLKGGGRNGANVHVRIRRLITNEEGISEPIILGEVIRDIKQSKTIPVKTYIKANDTSINSDQIEIVEEKDSIPVLDDQIDALYQDETSPSINDQITIDPPTAEITSQLQE